MTQAEFIAEVYGIAFEINPDIKHSTSYSDVVEELRMIKEKAIRWDILQAAFDLPKPELPVIKPSLKQTQANQAAYRQGQT